MANDSLISEIGIQKFNRLLQFRVKTGSDLLLAIKEALAVENIRAGVIVSGIGALEKAVFRNLKRFPENFPVKPEDRLYLNIEKPMELVSLGGWIAPRKDGVVEVHSHFSASMVEGDTVVALGGHLTEGTIAGIKVVVSIMVLDEDASLAEFDETTKTYDIVFLPRVS
jgi:predicted DNA-binding protein with PD1-like motif